MGICRSAAHDSLPHTLLPVAAGRFAAGDSIYSGGRVVLAGCANRSPRARVGGTTLRDDPERDLRCDRAAVSVEWQPADDELPRAESLDGLRLLRDSRDQAGRTPLLALVRSFRRAWTAGEVFDRALRVRDRCRPATDRAAPRVSQSMDLGRRRCCLPRFSPEFAVESSLRLAIRTANARDSRRRTRRCPRARGLLCSTDFLAQSDYRAHLAHGLVRAALLEAASSVSDAGMVLS